jgi:hypothetical protein
MRWLAVWIALFGVTCGACSSTSADGGLPRKETSSPLIGVYEPDAPASWAGQQEFTSATGVKPKIVVYYSGWYEKFWTSFANTAEKAGATTLVQLDPTGVSLNSISAGDSDAYLKSLAESVKKFGRPVLLSFAHEMNGTWYSWSSGQVPPTAFAAAWRHVVQIFRNIGATNARWVWTVTSYNETTVALRQWWPGSAWVNYVGIDGYYYTASDSFGSVFNAMLGEIRTFSKAPTIITEVGIGPNPSRPKQIVELYEGATADHFSGIIWFDEKQDNGIYHQDWRLEDDPVALAAFEKAVNSCCR